MREHSDPTRTQKTSPFPNWALVSGKVAKYLTVKHLLEEFEQRKAKKASGGGSRLTVRRKKQVGNPQGIEKEGCGVGCAVKPTFVHEDRFSSICKDLPIARWYSTLEGQPPRKVTPKGGALRDEAASALVGLSLPR